MVLMSSKLPFNLGMLASNENESPLKIEWRSPEPKACLWFRPSGKALASKDCAYADGAWILGGLSQRTPSRHRPVAGVTLNSNILAWQLPVSDVSTSQVWVRIQRPPGSVMFYIIHFYLAETPYHCLHNGYSNSLSLPGADMRTWLQTIERQQCKIRAMWMTQGKCQSNSGSSSYWMMPRNEPMPS